MTVEAALRVDGVWLGASGLPYADLTWTDRADGGNFEASFSLVQEYGSRPAPLYRGARVEVFVGPLRRWYGELAVCDWDSGTFTATGMSQRAYDFGARSSANQTSSVPNVVIDSAVLFDGWAVTRGFFSDTAVIPGDVTEDLNTVGAILDLSVSLGGKRWGIWGDGVVRDYFAPTVFDYVLAPGVLELGVTTEDQFSRILGRYIDSGSGVRSIAYGESQNRPVAHSLQDFTNLGPISSATAAEIAQNLVALSPTASWTNGVDVTSSQLLTPGGLPTELASVTAGQMVRASLINETGLGFQDFVIGETKHVAGTDILSISPVGKVAANLSEVMEDAYTRITGLPVAS